MDMGLVGQIAIAAMLLFFAYRLWPAAKMWMQDGPKGDTSDWTTAGLLLGGVILFVWILIKLV